MFLSLLILLTTFCNFTLFPLFVGVYAFAFGLLSYISTILSARIFGFLYNTYNHFYKKVVPFHHFSIRSYQQLSLS